MKDKTAAAKLLLDAGWTLEEVLTVLGESTAPVTIQPVVIPRPAPQPWPWVSPWRPWDTITLPTWKYEPTITISDTQPLTT